MADNVQFKNWQCYDDKPALCQEEALKRVLAFAGVHDVATDTAVLERFASGDASDYHMEDEEGTWSINNYTLQGIGGGVGKWYRVRHSTEVEIGFIATFDKTGNRGAFLFNSDDSYEGYLVWWTGTTVGVSGVDGTTETALLNLPVAETGAARVTVAVWPLRYTAIDEIDDLAVMLWFDDKHLMTHTMPYEERGKKIGFAVYQSDTITFDNLRVAQLHQLVEWASVDPGEAASASLSRIIGYEQIKARARYDGSVKVWRNEEETADWVVPTGRPLIFTENIELYPPSHHRLLGALHEIDTFRVGTQGHIFVVGQDPNALSEDETYSQGTRRHEMLEESAHTAVVEMAPNPAIEPEDVIDIDGETWRVGAINYRAAWRGDRDRGAPVLESNLQLRECL